ncbi:MAG: tetratricopeptide repeat protein [Dysgonomonas sp.]|nr:tetratricopeptide repeat protein [Dysgonomonas sp.]
MASRKERERSEEQDWNKIDDTVIRSGSFIMNYRNQILIGVGAIIVLIGIYWGYKTFYVEPKTKDAQVALFKGEQYFQAGQDSLALFGDGNAYMGFESIISEYGSTKTGDLAKAYAGLSYARLGQYDKALDYLKGFSGGDAMITPAVKGAIGDCLVNTGKAQDAVSYFEGAAKDASDLLLSPIFYKKAAMVYRDAKNYDKVIELFTKVRNDYMASPEAMEADKYIQEATILKGSN